MPVQSKVCRPCGTRKPLSELVPVNRNGKTYYRGLCLRCRAEMHKKYRLTDRARAGNARRAARLREKRASGETPERWIVEDSKKSDRKAGRQHDLDVEFVRQEIAKGCRYCGEDRLRMTMDRIDNARGHTKDNVVPACVRCNDTRKNMPYEAWLVVADGMRKARIAGLFGSWIGWNN